MAVPRIPQASFAGGVIAPALHARVDLVKYATGLKDASNFVVYAHGGAGNRPGLRFVAEAKSSGITRLLPFEFDVETQQTYQLAFTNLRMRVLRDGSAILETAKTVTGVSASSPTLITSVAHGIGNGDEVVLSGIVGPTALNGRNFIVKNVTSNTFTLEDMFGININSSAMPVYVSGGTARRVYEIATPYTESQLPKIDAVQENDVLYSSHRSHAPRKLARLADTNWSYSTLTFAPLQVEPTSLGGSAYFQKRTGTNLAMSWKVSSVGAGGEVSAASAAVTETVQYTVEDGRMVRLTWGAVSGASYYKVFRSDASTGLLFTADTNLAEFPTQLYVGDGATIPGASDPGAPAVPTSVSSSIVNGPSNTYKVAAISASTGEESVPSSSFSVRNALSYKGNRNDLFWTAAAGAASYVIYKKQNGRYGYVGQSDTLTFSDENIVPDLTQGPQEAFNPFATAGNYPGVVTFMEQRLCFAGSDNVPSGVWLGQSGNYENFSSASPATASDAITFRIRARQKNDIRAILPLKDGLGVFTSAGEWITNGGSEDFLTPASVVLKPQTYRGSSFVKPILVGSTVLYLQSRGNAIRSFAYDFANDNFSDNDLTVMARHLFDEHDIIAWAYAQAPHSVVWAVRADGKLLSLTYVREHEVWAWMPHETDGFFEDVSVVAEGEADVPYFVVRRIINGQTKRYIERMDERVISTAADGFFVDSGLSYSGPPVSTVSGLWHLEGKEVVALADGNVARGLTVVDGSVTLPHAASIIHVGLPYQAFIQTLDIDMGSVGGLGSVQGRNKTVANIIARVEKSRGMWAGNTRETAMEWKQRSFEDWNEETNLYTGTMEVTPETDWTKGGSIVIEQRDPLPLTILSVIPEIVVGG